METLVDLKRMSTSDKLRLMEDLWQDLSAGTPEIKSPAWHGDLLLERERLTASGEESFVEWESAKKQLRGELA